MKIKYEIIPFFGLKKTLLERKGRLLEKLKFPFPGFRLKPVAKIKLKRQLTQLIWYLLFIFFTCLMKTNQKNIPFCWYYFPPLFSEDGIPLYYKKGQAIKLVPFIVR